MPEVVLFDGEWGSGDPIDSAQRLMSDPEFAFKCRIVVLSRNSSQDYLISAARAGIHEVITKPVDMNELIAQLEKHSMKRFVPLQQMLKMQQEPKEVEHLMFPWP